MSVIMTKAKIWEREVHPWMLLLPAHRTQHALIHCRINLLSLLLQLRESCFLVHLAFALFIYPPSVADALNNERKYQPQDKAHEPHADEQEEIQECSIMWTRHVLHLFVYYLAATRIAATLSR
jgi:hypothetical protein